MTKAVNGLTECGKILKLLHGRAEYRNVTVVVVVIGLNWTLSALLVEYFMMGILVKFTAGGLARHYFCFEGEAPLIKVNDQR